ncbi:NB-ARC domain-containing protein [Dactylosporangium sp. NPDC050588]|uniref:ATP-binding protein n=1 Tax=Dactylosporangium sp. NPDC050588 TaxID=3157211 RepID=UPI00340DF9BE
MGNERVFGALLRDLRLAVRLTQEELAERAAVSSRTVRDLERGAVAAPRASTAALLADAVGLAGRQREEFLVAARDALWSSRRAAGPAAEPHFTVPRQLPAPVTHFTGRTQELDTLDRLTRSRSGDGISVIAVVGPGGIGKTALAVHWANHRAGEFPDGQLHIDLRGYDTRSPVTPLDAVSTLLRAVGVPGKQIPTTADEAASLFRSLVAQRRLLIVLDNARGADQVRPLLPGGGGSVVVVTSRARLSGLVALDGAVLLNVDVLPLPDAVGLLAGMLGAERVAAESPAAAQLALACAGLPLALRIAAANIATRAHGSIADLVEALRHDSLGTLTTDDEQTTVRTVFEQSYRTLDAPQRRAFRLLAVAPGETLGVPAAAALLDTPVVDTRRLVRALTGAHLLDELPGQRYRFHDLVRAYARERSEVTDTRDDASAALTRLYRAYLATVDGAARLLYPERLRLPVAAELCGPPLAEFAGRDAANEWLTTERDSLIHAVPQAVRHGRGQEAWLLADALRGYFWLGGHWNDWLLTATIGHDAARAAGAHDGEGASLLSIAQAHLHQGRLADAIAAFEAAAAAMHRAGWGRGEIAARGHLGMTYLVAGRIDAARAAHLQAEALCRSTGWLQGTAFTLHRLAATETAAGNLDAALNYAWRGKQTFEALGDRHGEAHTLLNIAIAHRDAGRLGDALRTAGAALDLAVELGQPILKAEAEIALGTIHLEAGRHDEASAFLGRALVVSRDECSRLFEVEALIGLAGAEAGLGRGVDAVRTAEAALAISEVSAFRIYEGDAHMVLACAHRTLGDAGRANEHAERSHEIHLAAGHRRSAQRAAALLAALSAA